MTVDSSGYLIDHYSFVQGQQVADMDESGGIHVLQGLTDFSNSDSSSRYVVQAGDTLQSIAQSIYGDSSLYYIVGSANGISDSSGLVVGQAITLPSVTNHQNSASTFKPYNPSSIVGSTTPSLPVAPPPPSAHHCNALATIVVIAVIVVATIAIAGAAAVAAGATEGIFASGTAVLTGSAVAAGGAAGVLSAGAVLGAAFVGATSPQF